MPTDVTSPDLERKLAAIPNSPGVYVWKDAKGDVLYVGKAASLRQRVRNYFSADFSDSPKNRRLVSLIADIETIVVPSESQSLLLENNLIKEYQPRFNIRLRDDKSYPSIAVTLAEAFPRVLVVRRLDMPGARYFGPYTDVAILRRTLRVIRRIFTVRSCHYGLPEDAPDRPCLDFHINRCLAPCVGLQNRDDYQRMIDDVIAFLEGKTLEVRSGLRSRMEEAAGKLDFERAADLRNAIQWLDQIERPQVVETVGGGDADAIGFARDGDDAVGVLVRVRDGRMVGREQRFLHNLAEEPDAAILSAFLVQHYRLASSRARKTALPFPPTDFDELISLMPETRWSVPQRGSGSRMVELADQNARHLMESFRIESFETDERAEDPVYALGRDLGLTTVPRSLVCIDASTNQGRDTVGALVWFEAGRPKKSEYRRFKIRGDAAGGQGREAERQRGRRGAEREAIIVDAPADSHPLPLSPSASLPDDFAAIREIVSRYITRRVDEKKPLPDLMVIDGGKGQLGVALEALREADVKLPVISLAKREEEVFLPGRADSLRLPRSAPSLKLLQRARDEAHRFAITFNRKRRTGRTITSELLNIPGVGPAKRRLLLEKFGSLAGVRLATATEVAALPGFSTRLAERILNHLKQ